MTRRLWQRSFFVILSLIVALAATGCMGRRDPVEVQITGHVVFGPRNLLMEDESTVYLMTEDDTVVQQRSTRNNGRFSFSGIHRGDYILVADSPAGLVGGKVRARDDMNLLVQVPYPPAVSSELFHEERFLEVSGLWYWDVDSHGDLYHTTGPNRRWRRPLIRIFVSDGSELDAGSDQPVPAEDWRNYALLYMKQFWYGLPMSWEEAADVQQADLYIAWSKAGSLGDNVSAHIIFPDTAGYNDRVIMVIDESFPVAQTQLIFAHELWHTLGVGHINNESSVMYPRATEKQFTPYALADSDKGHLALAYLLLPNQMVSTGPAAMSAIAEAPNKARRLTVTPNVVTVLTDAQGRTTTVNGIPKALRNIAGVDEMTARTKTGDSGRFLWEQIEAGL